MRKTFTTIALVAMLGALVVSCQKENIIDDPPLLRKTSPCTR